MCRLPEVVHVDVPGDGILVDRSGDLDDRDVVRVLSATAQYRRSGWACDAVTQREARIQGNAVRCDLVAGRLVPTDRLDGERLVGGRPIEHVPGEPGRTQWPGTGEKGCHLVGARQRAAAEQDLRGRAGDRGVRLSVRRIVHGPEDQFVTRRLVRTDRVDHELHGRGAGVVDPYFPAATPNRLGRVDVGAGTAAAPEKCHPATPYDRASRARGGRAGVKGAGRCVERPGAHDLVAGRVARI